jgi:hypothetical protein
LQIIPAHIVGSGERQQAHILQAAQGIGGEFLKQLVIKGAVLTGIGHGLAQLGQLILVKGVAAEFVPGAEADFSLYPGIQWCARRLFHGR